ncbi:MAG: sodium:proton antiporter [Mucilaginibacter sp.]|uniref:sodium:proton antiporter n=1 Tax=Mucilaginibacter sp. TaxID=1882438 RepID=UPI0034E4CB13
MTTYTALIILSGLVIFSYVFDLISKKTKVPSVLLLLFLGIGLRYVVDYIGFKTFNFLMILPALGTLGLILIVLEGALELKYDKEKNGLILRSFFSALGILLATSVVLALILQHLSGGSFSNCFLNAIPFSIVSSSIAIPSASAMDDHKKEYIIYEASFSDILGIVLFNFALYNPNIKAASFVNLGLETLSILLLSVVSCLFMLYLISRLQHHVKFFLIISILVLVYAFGEQFHLSALILVLAFGLFLNNANQIKLKWFRKYFLYPKLSRDLRQLFQLSAESAFIIRTFFFVIFGFTMDLWGLANLEVLEYGLAILAAIYLIRFLSLKYIAKTDLLPEVFITPRGLISILLYYNLPDNLKLKGIETGLLFMIILGTSIIMSIGLLFSKRRIAVET